MDEPSVRHAVGGMAVRLSRAMVDVRFPTTLAVVGGLALIAGYSGWLAWAMAHTSYEQWGGLVIGPVLFAVSAPFVIQIARRHATPRFAYLLLLALGVKLLASLVRYYVGFEIYGRNDAREYLEFGRSFIEPFRNGMFEVELGRGRFAGTAFVRFLTGLVLAVIGDTAIGAFLLFAWMGFIGLLFFWLAFRIAFPDGDYRRYSLLLFFLPSLLYWPSSVGKDAWMLLGLGLASYGAARVLQRQPIGYVALVLGVAATSLVRPHIAALVCAGFVTAYALRPSGKAFLISQTAKIVGLGVLSVGMLFVVQQAEEYFGVGEDEETEEEQGISGSVNAVLDEAERRTAAGGSEFDAQRPSSPLEFPNAVVSVLFRPFPHEAHNKQALLSSLEGLVLLALFFTRLSRWWYLPRQLWRRPYLLLVIIYASLFIFAFSSFGNFGILVRQRIQVLPFVLMLLALPHPNPKRLVKPQYEDESGRTTAVPSSRANGSIT